MRPPPVLILDGPPRIVVTVARCLHRLGVAVDVAQLSSEDVPGLPSRAIRRVIRLRDHREDPDRFLAEFQQLIKAGGYDMLIPASDPALILIGRYYDALGPLLRVCCPPPEVTRRVLDKALTVEAAKRCGVSVPRTFRLGDTESESSFPVVAKPVDKTKTGRVQYFHSAEELRSAAEADPDLCSSYLLQEYFHGDGVGIETLISDGRPLVMFQHRRLKEYPARGGVSVLAVSEPVDPELGRLALTLLGELNWDGVAMVELRHDRATGRASLIEVNGRYWGSLPLSVYAGLSFPAYEWQLAHGETPRPPADYRQGVRIRWTVGAAARLAELGQDWFAGRIKLSRLAAETVQFAGDFRPGTRDALWSWSDPLPALAEASSVLRKRLPRLKPR